MKHKKNQARLNSTLKYKEKGLVKLDTKNKIVALEHDTHLLLELELAEIFKLSNTKAMRIIDEHIGKTELTLSNVMNELERVTEEDRELVLA